MASELELRWLKTNDFKGPAKRFAVFCKEDIKSQADSKSFSLDVYQDAIKLVLSKLDRSLSLVELTNRIAAEEESQKSELDFSLDDADDSNTEEIEISSSGNVKDNVKGNVKETEVEDIITEGKHDAN